MQNIKPYLSIAAFVASIVIGFTAMFIPPAGVIDASILWYTAQLLCFTAGLLGINFNIDSFKKTASTNVEKR